MHAVRDDDCDLGQLALGFGRGLERLVPSPEPAPPVPVPVPEKAELLIAAGNWSTGALNAARLVALAALKSALARTLMANIVYQTSRL
jgi:hypothetical protein